MVAVCSAAGSRASRATANRARRSVTGLQRRNGLCHRLGLLRSRKDLKVMYNAQGLSPEGRRHLIDMERALARLLGSLFSIMLFLFHSQLLSSELVALRIVEKGLECAFCYLFR